MKAGLVLPLCLLCYGTFQEVHGQHSEKWEHCNCKWAPWNPWSQCSRGCWGIQIRKRQVWKKNTPECMGFKVCDMGQGAVNLKRCNTVCTAGTYNMEEKKCVCPAGLYGECCDKVVTCGKAPAIINSNIPDASYNYSEVVRFKCNHGYRLMGKPEMVCGTNGWNGNLPECVAEDPCEGVTCLPGEVCRPHDKSYTCTCPKNAPCNLNLAPEVVSCPDSKNITTPDRTLVYKWEVPKFKDAGGENLTIESNYPSNHFRFPWGSHTVQYTATKKSNGQSTSCQFSVNIKPLPCKKLSAPDRGYLICSNWRTDYGTFCLMGCTGNYEMSADFDPRQWIVCGSSGTWTPANIPNECNVVFGGRGASPKEGALQMVDECLSEGTTRALKDQFLNIFKRSPFKAFCNNHARICRSDNVLVECWDNSFKFY